MPAGGVQPDVQDVVVGFAQQQLQARYFAAMQVESEEIAREQGFTLLFQAANKDPVVQMNQMQAMLAQGANVLVVNATSVKGQKEMMTQIASTVPVIYIDTSVPGTGTTSVQSDNLTIGRESGKITAKRFLDMGKDTIKMVILTGPATDEFVGPNRRQGFLDGLTEGGLKYEIKSEQSGDYQQDKGQVAAENMLAANPDVDLVLGLNDSMTLGAYNAIKDKPQYENVYVAASADGQREAQEYVEIGSDTGGLDTVVTGLPDGAPVDVGIRPQDCSITADAARGVTCTVAYFGHLLEFGLVTGTVAGREDGIVVQTPAAESYEPDQQVVVTAPPECVYLFDVESGDRLR